MMRLAFLPLGIQCVEIDAPRLDFIAFKENEMQRDWQRQAWKSWSSLNTYALIWLQKACYIEILYVLY